jgi:hypothetical protein
MKTILSTLAAAAFALSLSVAKAETTAPTLQHGGTCTKEQANCTFRYHPSCNGYCWVCY